MLSKYDDEEEEALVSMGQDGTLDDEQVRADSTPAELARAARIMWPCHTDEPAVASLATLSHVPCLRLCAHGEHPGAPDGLHG